MRKPLTQDAVKAKLEEFKQRLEVIEKEVGVFMSQSHLPDSTFRQVLSTKKKLEELSVTLELGLSAVNMESNKFGYVDKTLKHKNYP